MGRKLNEGQIPGDIESLEDQVYRPQILERSSKVRKANPFITIPLTLLGYGVLGLLGWWLVQHTRSTGSTNPESVVVDLQDQTLPDAPQTTVPSPPPAAGGPPPGAIEKADAPPPPPAVTQEAVPDKPPAELPTQDLSNVAVPAQPAGGANGTGPGSGLGPGGTSEGTGTGSGPGGKEPLVLHFDNSPVKERYRPPEPPYPPLARVARIQGNVTVEITVGVDGIPISAHAVEGPMQLRSAAEAYAMKWRFEPVIENGAPVIGSWSLKVSFQLK